MSNEKKESSEIILQLLDIKKYYPVKKGIFFNTANNLKAVDGVNLDLYRGETLGIVGESGCGKSTIGKLITRLENLTAGKIIFNNEDISNYSSREMKRVRAKLQMIFQDPFSSLNPRKRIYEILAEPILVHKIAVKHEVEKEVKRLLNLVGLPDKAKDRFPHEFSGGQRQRIGIARALSLKPEIIICDEPVSALDVSVQAQILNLLKQLQKELNLTYIFIGHGLGTVKYISDRIAVMYLGKIVEVASSEELFSSPEHPYTRALIDAAPVTDPYLRSRSRIVLQGDVPSPVNPPKGCRFHTRCPVADEKCRNLEPILEGQEHRVACIKASV